MLNPEDIRKEFPILTRRVHGKPLIYLDNAATTQKPQRVIDAEVRYYQETNANIHRGVHALSQEATTAYEAARQRIADFIGAGSPESVIFTRGTTESVNLVAYGWARKFLKAGDEILLTAIEHHSNLIPWQMAAAQTGAVLKFIPVTPAGELDLSGLKPLLTPRTKLVSVTAMSNVLGTISPVAEITAAARKVGAKVFIDGAQSVPHLPTRVQDLGCDFLAFSAHKMLGPTGIGVLWGKPELLESMDPFMSGGDMILEVWRDHATWNELPWKFEAGTPPIAGAIAFAEAVAWLERYGMRAVREHEKSLTAYAIERLSMDKRVTLYGPRDVEKRGGVVSFNFADIHPHDIGTLLDQEGIAIRAGHHCCQPLMRDWGLSGTARASFYVYNTREDVDALAEALKKAAAIFAGV